MHYDLPQLDNKLSYHNLISNYQVPYGKVSMLSWSAASPAGVNLFNSSAVPVFRFSAALIPWLPCKARSPRSGWDSDSYWPSDVWKGDGRRYFSRNFQSPVWLFKCCFDFVPWCETSFSWPWFTLTLYLTKFIHTHRKNTLLNTELLRTTTGSSCCPHSVNCFYGRVGKTLRSHNNTYGGEDKVLRENMLNTQHTLSLQEIYKRKCLMNEGRYIHKWFVNLDKSIRHTYTRPSAIV